MVVCVAVHASLLNWFDRIKVQLSTPVRSALNPNIDFSLCFLFLVGSARMQIDQVGECFSAFSIPPTWQLNWHCPPAQQPLCRAANNPHRSVHTIRVDQYHSAKGCFWRFNLAVPMGDVQLALSHSIDGTLPRYAQQHRHT
ncbi:hypothetical protein ACQY0O_000697 [Thecaphora frezii]